MRIRLFSVFAALLFVAPAFAADDPSDAALANNTATAQQDVPKTSTPTIPDIGTTNRIDFGLRGTSYAENSDRARYQRYQDLRDGATVDLFRYAKKTDAWLFNAEGNHIGYKNQDISASFNQFGKVKADFQWNQVPLYYSATTRTLYSSSTPGVLAIDDAIQLGIQNKTTTLPAVMAGAPAFDLEGKRNQATLNFVYSASRNFDLKVIARDIHRSGAQPYAGSFGISGAVASEMAAPIDTRTNEVTTAAEWSNDRGFARLAYDGSFFRNDLSSLTFDNPARAVDSPTAGPAAGRLAMAPPSDMNTVSATGQIKLPGRSSAYGYVSFADMNQNAALIPMTVNSAFGNIPLPRATAKANAQVTSMNYNFTSRPTNMLWFTARYRQYDFSNRTEEFQATQYVNWDASLVNGLAENEPAGYTRHTFDGEASFTPYRYVGFRAGYTREQVDRTFRIVDTTTEDIGRASVDLTGIPWITVRGVYEHGVRNGTEAKVDELIAIGEQPTLRQFDISDRTRDRFSTIVQVSPLSNFSVNGTVGVGREEYPGTNFGLRSNDNNVYSLGFDFVPSDAVNLGMTYSYEEYRALQASRTANPLPAGGSLADPTQQFNDPRRDWTDDSKDLVHSINASADFLKLIPRTEIRLDYDMSKGRSTYVYGLTPDTVIAAPVQLPAVKNELHRATTDVLYNLTKHVAIGGVYWYDRYLVNDFALDPQPGGLALPVANPALMMIGYTTRPYTANTVWGRLSFLW